MCMNGGGCMCNRCSAGVKVALGALVLLNIYAWPKWIGNVDRWIAFFAALFILKGVLKFIMPSCPHCKAETPARKGK